MRPSISVVIPTYNHARFLEQAIDSALGQTFEPHEVIVVDDGSTDGTAELCSRYGDAIAYRRQDNAGLSAARNAGIAYASGDFVHLLDADDVLTPAAFQLIAEAIGSSAGADVYRGSWGEIDAAGRSTVSVDARELGRDPFHELFDPLAVGPPCSYTVRRSALLEAGPFDVRLKSCEDWDMWLRIALVGGSFAVVSGTGFL
jgi:glycosyltransferase involved in cell wall biosynthesis